MEQLLDHGPFLEQLARALVADEHAARDLVQETWVAALERPPRHGANPRAWLAQVLRRTHWSRRRRREPLSVGEPVDRRDPPATIELAGLRAALAGALRELDEPSRTVVLLRFVDDLPPRAIAARVGAPVSTVHTRLQRALGRLRGRLDREYGRATWAALLLGRPAVPREGPPRPGGAPRAPSTPWVAAALLAGVAYVALHHAHPPVRDTVAAAPPAALDPTTAPVEPAGTVATGGGPTSRVAEVVGEALREVERVASSSATAAAVPRLAVQVVDPSGRPVAGANVLTISHAEPPGFVVLGTTDREGRFAVEVVPTMVGRADDPIFGGRVCLSASHRAWTQADLHYVVARDGAFTLALGPPGTTVRGRVLGTDGEPLADARVDVGVDGGLVERDGVLRGTLRRVGRTAADGTFDVRRVPAGAQLVHVSAPGRATERTFTTGVPDEWLEVVLSPAGRVEGVVRGPDGAPLPGAEVGWSRTTEPDDPPRARTGPDGAYRLDGLAPGPLHVFARDPRRPALVATRRVTVEGGRSVAWDPWLAPTAGLAVELVGAQGERLAGWNVTVASDDGLWHADAITDESGELRLLELPDAPLSVAVLGPALAAERGGVPRLVRHGLTPGPEPLRVVVPAGEPTARVRGALVDADGHPPAGARILVQGEGGVSGDVAVDPRTGRFETAALPAGAWHLRAFLGNLGSFDLGAVELEDGDERDLGRVAAPQTGTLWPTWTALPGDRILVSHLVRGQAYVSRALHLPPTAPVPLLAGDVVIALRRGADTVEQAVTVPAGSELAVDLDSLLDARAGIGGD